MGVSDKNFKVSRYLSKQSFNCQVPFATNFMNEQSRMNINHGGEPIKDGEEQAESGDQGEEGLREYDHGVHDDRVLVGGLQEGGHQQ